MHAINLCGEAPARQTARLTGLVLCWLLAWAPATLADTDLSWGVGIQQDYVLTPNITYLNADGYESKLDVIAPRDHSTARPVLLYFHGGGWVGGDKDRMFLHFLPYLQMGMAVVNVEYRLARHALAPAAVEDGRCALRWLITNAADHGLDTERIVVSGHSAGGHLSLTTGMLPAAAGLDRRCPAPAPDAGRAGSHEPDMRVAAIVNWFGITDVADVIGGPNASSYAAAWMGTRADWRDVATRVSPLTYVRNNLPPILTIHGDADTIVPYAHATRLHKALHGTNTQHKLVTIKGGGHGGFTLQENLHAMQTIQAFLQQHGVLP